MQLFESLTTFMFALLCLSSKAALRHCRHMAPVLAYGMGDCSSSTDVAQTMYA